jgi:hypothetical protein
MGEGGRVELVQVDGMVIGRTVRMADGVDVEAIVARPDHGSDLSLGTFRRRSNARRAVIEHTPTPTPARSEEHSR